MHKVLHQILQFWTGGWDPGDPVKYFHGGNFTYGFLEAIVGWWTKNCEKWNHVLCCEYGGVLPSIVVGYGLGCNCNWVYELFGLDSSSLCSDEIGVQMAYLQLFVGIISNVILYMVSVLILFYLQCNGKTEINDKSNTCSMVKKQIFVIMNNKTLVYDIKSIDQTIESLLNLDGDYFLISNGKICDKKLILSEFDNETTFYVHIRGFGGSEMEDDKSPSASNYLDDDEYKNCITKPEAKLLTRLNIFGEEELIPTLRAPKFFIGQDGVNLIFKNLTVDEIKKEVKDSIEVKKSYYYGKYGISLAFCTEKDLFINYHKILDPHIKKNLSFIFGGWRGNLMNGGIYNHPGRVKVNNLLGNTKNYVTDFIKSKVAEIFGKDKIVLESYIDTLRDTTVKRWNTWWSQLYFIHPEDAETFMNKLCDLPGCQNLIANGTGKKNCSLCGRSSCKNEDCKLYGLRLQFNHVTNMHMRIVFNDKLKVKYENMVMGNDNKSEKPFCYLWYDSIEQRNEVKEEVKKLIANGVISYPPMAVTKLQLECKHCGYLAKDETDVHLNSCPQLKAQIEKKNEKKKKIKFQGLIKM